ncbi:axoneme central apparatus protein [Trypanosoma equiperdum]|uniref:Sperm-associated antigen 6 n=3 Tax=Trypanozoon TaxID=39700 RepID=Q4GYV5_TRYB2|nr:axoneme central apparatus protein; importin alpha-1 subunit [Trypanosoma brucei brucei TREU927]XP_011771423.1 axoneme central apparatus protein, putative [Trypanosoma brucei gambiense DAL972]CAJ16416.1 axoneme central apparatus protein, putative; importin alpha-1 subunit, putative [Trypanosoma brucei brucei TREU927]CBH08982.1 axoneme central apparatus protein, putative [Trypanosoma brucei gambiense DAL972]SCU71131.1 axoneme central apparatus protein [Trypanosoma equiperdum]|eukprot:XP_011771423.1 axoneme central apparatus protein, putative [Trypanosoma brucei gambiense DAL972]
MPNRQIIQVFEEYQRARVKFVQTVADFASKPQHIDALQQAGVMQLLRPLLLDNVPSIQQSAALALGRLANYNEELAESVVSGDILAQLVYSLGDQSRFYKKSAAFVLRSVARHNAQLAQAVVGSQAVEALVGCLEDFDPTVKESAVWALGYVARHNAHLAQEVVDKGAIPPLVLCVQEPELSLKRTAASTLADIAKHLPELAQAVVDQDAVTHLAPLIGSNDGKLKRQVCQCLAQIAKHSVELAELVVEGEIFPRIFSLLKDSDETVRKNASTCIREVAKHTPELAQLIVNAGGVGALVDYTNESTGSARLPGIMTLGYISAFSETLALAVIVSCGIEPLSNALEKEQEDHIKSAAAWSLGQIGRHSADHAKAVADCNVLPKLLDLYLHPSSSDDLRMKSKRALKNIIQRCVQLPALEPLLHPEAPKNVLKYVCGQFAKVLPTDIAAKREFVANRGLATVQRIQPEPGSKLAEYIQSINNCYPPEIVQYYSPQYAQTFLEKIENYHVQQVQQH